MNQQPSATNSCSSTSTPSSSNCGNDASTAVANHSATLTSAATSPLTQYRRIAIATGDGATTFNAKTAISLLRYRPNDVIAVIDGVNAGKTAEDHYRTGGATPIVASLAEADQPDAVFVGIAPAGGQLPAALRQVLVEAVERGIDVVSGLHDFLCEDAQLCQLAERSDSRLIDVRKNNLKLTAKAQGLRPDCLRIHAVGHDCSVGKMVASLEIEKGLRQRNYDAQFLATGQTGIMIVGSGIPIDCVVSDFVNGAIENLVLENQDHDILLIEGQGSITHPAFSAVTMGLLHGCAPQGLILCYEAGRTHVKGLSHMKIPSLERFRELYEAIASERFPSEVIGVAMNSRNLTAEEAEQEKADVSARLGLPVCDVYRDGPDVLVDAVLALKQRLFA